MVRKKIAKFLKNRSVTIFLVIGRFEFLIKKIRMKNLVKTILSLAFFGAANVAIAQDFDLKIGDWKSYLPFQQGKYVTQSDKKVFYTTPFSVVAVDKEDFSTEFFSKVNRLNDAGVAFSKFNPANNTLAVIYNNSNIDLLKPNGNTVNLSDVKLNNTIIGDKRINDIYFENNRLAYLSCGFGVLQLDMVRNEFLITVFTNLKVNAVTIFRDSIYAATEKGIYRVSRNGNNLADFGTWQRLDETDGFPMGDYSSTALVSFNGKLYLDINSALCRYENGLLTTVFYKPHARISYISADGGHLLMGYFGNGEPGQFWRGYIFDTDETRRDAGDNCVNGPFYAVEDQKGRIWYADEQRNFRMSDNTYGSCKQFSYNSPYSHNISKFAFSDSTLWVASGGVDQSDSRRYRSDGGFYLKENEWKAVNRFNNTLLDSFQTTDFYTVAAHPSKNLAYYGTLWNGIVEFDPVTKGVFIFNRKNSTLQGAIGDDAREIVTGLAFDKDENLWVSNQGAAEAISVRKKDGTWRKFTAPGANSNLWQVVIDDNGYKWFACRDAGLLVYDSGKNIDATGDDNFKLYTTTNSKIGGRVNCVAKDLNGDMWVGTTKGATVFECSPFSASCKGNNRIVLQDGIPAYLLESETVNCIAIDGANRKWFGTTNGIFVQSPNGEEQVARFTTANSPLFDNNILDIAIQPNTGEVFIGTNKGVLSYRGEAITGGLTHDSQVYAFPNPVRPDYTGPIAIKGLAQDADIKITDVQGQLVYATKALGGQAIWDGRDYTGRRAASGVYLVYATAVRNANNPEAVVTKILIVN